MKIMMLAGCLLLLSVVSLVALTQPVDFQKLPTAVNKVTCPEPVYQKPDDFTKTVTLKSKFESDITEEARRHRVNGCVYLKVVFCKTGKITDVRVVEGLPYGLTEQSIKAARKIRFKPAEKDGQPVSQRLQIQSCFNIR